MSDDAYQHGANMAAGELPADPPENYTPREAQAFLEGYRAAAGERVTARTLALVHAGAEDGAE